MNLLVASLNAIIRIVGSLEVNLDYGDFQRDAFRKKGDSSLDVLIMLCCYVAKNESLEIF